MNVDDLLIPPNPRASTIDLAHERGTARSMTDTCAQCQAPARYSVMDITPLRVEPNPIVRLLCGPHASAALPAPGRLVSIRNLTGSS